MTGTWHNILGDGEEDAVLLSPTVVPRSGDDVVLKWASVQGVNMGGSWAPGAGNSPRRVDGCVCAYDIETDISAKCGADFPLLYERILSVCMWCTCGYMRALMPL
jgi:hypothetical protein